MPKIISGTLEMMPAGPPWDEEAFEEWMELFKGACRIYYRLPKPGPRGFTAIADLTEAQRARILDEIERFRPIPSKAGQ